MVQDGGEIGLGEPSVDGGMTQRPIDLSRGEQPGQLGRGSHLDPHLAGACCGGLDQPQAGSLAQGEELALRGGARLRRSIQRTCRGRREMTVIELRAARRGAGVASDL